MTAKKAKPTPKAKKPPIDWEGMDPLWRAGIWTVSALSQKFGVSRAGINKHWDELGVTRDLKGQIQQKAASIVARSEVNAKRLHEKVARRAAVTGPVTDAETIETNGQIQADAILTERRDVRRYRSLSIALFEELEAQTIDRELYERLGEMMDAPDEKGIDRLNELYRKIIGTSGRIDNFKKLSEALKTLIALEREVLNIANDAVQSPPTPESSIATITLDFDAIRKKLEGVE
jgi:hypothetical protein